MALDGPQLDAARSLVIQLKSKLDLIKDDELSVEAHFLLTTCRGVCDKLRETLSAPEPLAAPGPRGPVGLAAEPAPAAASLRSVLVIDDDEDVQRTMRFLLPKKGPFVVTSITDPLEALTYLQTARPDVVLMDLMMPQMTGFELLQRLRADPRIAGIKIIVGSSRSYDKDRIAVLQSGANEFIAKPYNFAELVLRLKHLAG